MTTTTQVRFTDLTRLPTREVMKNDGISSVLIVTTPHRWEVSIDFDRTKFFGGNAAVLGSDIVNQIRQLEIESRAFLFRQWVAEATGGKKEPLMTYEAAIERYKTEEKERNQK